MNDIALLTRLRHLVIKALASEDTLVESLILKGGNAIDLAYKDNNSNITRTSFDLDYSIIDSDFNSEFDEIKKKLERTLDQTFIEDGFKIFDFRFEPRPEILNEKFIDFWGGYMASFKATPIEKYDLKNFDMTRRGAISFGKNNSTVFTIDFSKHEYVPTKNVIDFQGYRVNVYTPEMIVFEKLRAICQQLPEYTKFIGSRPKSRARDFYDIYILMQHYNIDLTLEENRSLIRNMFKVKKAPLHLINKIRTEGKEIHKSNWDEVKATVPAGTELHNFDYYFEYVLELFEPVFTL